MKKVGIVIFSLALFLLITPVVANASDLSSRLKGRILLQVQSNGEAWYVEPVKQERHYLGRPNDAFNIMRGLGLGISERDYYSFNNIAPARLSGKILLRVEAKGEAYYVNPLDLKMHYLGRPADAFNVMRGLGLGITNSDLEKIKNGMKEYSHKYGFSFMYPNDAEVVSQFNTIKISNKLTNQGEWQLTIHRNYDRDDLSSWLNNVYANYQNEDCQQLESNIVIKGAETVLFTAKSMADACEAGGYYTISPDKLVVVKWNLGHDPVFFDVIKNSFRFNGLLDTDYYYNVQ